MTWTYANFGCDQGGWLTDQSIIGANLDKPRQTLTRVFIIQLPGPFVLMALRGFPVNHAVLTQQLMAAEVVPHNILSEQAKFSPSMGVPGMG